MFPLCTTEITEKVDLSVAEVDFLVTCMAISSVFVTNIADLYCLYGDYPGCEQRIPTSWKVNVCELHLQQAKEEG